MIDDSSAFQQAIFVQMFRRWAAAREAQVDGRLAMAELYCGPGTAIMAAVACDSLFELVEAQLGRRLEPGRCCSQALSPDEAALIGLLRHSGPIGAIAATTAIPHGLPGAICWAARAVRRELGFSQGLAAPAPESAHCPFRSREEMVPQKGLEPPTPTLRMSCSTN